MFLQRTILAWLWALMILGLCLLPADEIPEDRVKYADKIFHSLSFTVLTFLLIPSFIKQYTFPRLRSNAIKVSLLFSIIFGGAIELLQHWGVKNRNGEWTDWLFDTAGSLLGVVLFLLVYGVKQIKKQRR